MTVIQTIPSPQGLQLSAADPEGHSELVIVAKRSYDVDDSGRFTPASEQAELRAAPQWDPGLPELLCADIDIYTHKLRTDVVVQGHVHGDGRRGRLLAEVAVGARSYRMLVLGTRHCTLDPAGKPVFSDPAPVERVPLRYTHAYGGRDVVFEQLHGNPLRSAPRFRGAPQAALDAASPFLYPRNPVGRGYLIAATRAAVEALELPQLEDPADPLTPERLAAGDCTRWYLMPLPRGTDWLDYAWYPRIAYFGVVPICARFDAPPAEVTRGLAHAELAAGDGRKPPGHAWEACSGASLELQHPHLRGGERVSLQHLHPRRTRWELTVPPAPEVAIDGRDGGLRSVEPVLQTLLVEPDRGRVTVVWRGSGRTRRRHLPQELATMPMRIAWRE